MVILFDKRKISHILFLSLTVILLAALFPQTVSNTTVDVYRLLGTADEEREYWAGSEDIYWDIRIPDKVIALTFDDGPHPRFTPRIVELLNTYDAKATFFVIGKQAKEYPEVVRLVHEHGHEIANHTYTHPRMRYISPDALLKEIGQTHALIKEITGEDPVLFRPPGGYYNKRIVTSVKQVQYKVILWSFTQDTRDWSDPGVKKIINTVLKNAANGDIIIFHDSGGDRRQTIQSLEVILPELKSRGFEFITVSELLQRRNVHSVS